MKQDKANIGSQSAKERETVRQLSRSCLYIAITLIILIAVILYFVVQESRMEIKVKEYGTNKSSIVETIVKMED